METPALESQPDSLTAQPRETVVNLETLVKLDSINVDQDSRDCTNGSLKATNQKNVEVLF